MCHCHTRCAACDEQGQGECLLGGNGGGLRGTHAYLNHLDNIPLSLFVTVFSSALFVSLSFSIGGQIIALSICVAHTHIAATLI